jgi:hypothetical protein
MKKDLYSIALVYISLALLPAMCTSGSAQTMAATKTTMFLTVKKPMLGFQISYPSDWNITDNDSVITFRAPKNAALVALSISHIPSKTNFTLEQYTSTEISRIKSVESSKDRHFFNLLESTPNLLSGNPGHKIVFLNGTNADVVHKYKNSIVWTLVDGKIYKVQYTADASNFAAYFSTITDMVNSFQIL